MRQRWWPNEVGVQDLAWSVGCVLWGSAFFVHCLSPPRNINRYWMKCWGRKLTVEWPLIQGGSSDTLSCFMLRNRDRLLLGEPLGSSADCIFVFKRLCHYNCYKHLQTVSEKHHHDDKIVSRICTSWNFKRIKKCFLFTFNQGSTSSCTEEPPTLDLSKIPAQLLIPSEDLNLQDILGRVNCPNFSFLSMFLLL